MEDKERFKTPIHSRFIREVVEPLNSVLTEELTAEERPRILDLCQEFGGGYIVRIKDLPHTANDSDNQEDNAENQTNA